MKTKHSNNNASTSSRGRGRPKKDTGDTVIKTILKYIYLLFKYREITPN